MPDTVSPWLATMRALTGTEEYAGGADNPIIIGWREEIAALFPRMANYARSYKHDATAWCGHVLAVAMARNGIEPPYNSNEAFKSYMWVDAWLDWGAPVALGQQQIGDVLIFSTPHHVTLYEGQEGDYYLGRGGNQSDAVQVSRYHKSGLSGIRRPPAPAVQPRAARRFTNIWASVFADAAVAYPDVAPGWNERPGVALPAWIAGPRPRVRVVNTANNRAVVCEIIDQGPWNFTSKPSGLPGDPYWLTGMRPQAESGVDMIGRKTNLAGIDLTPAAARALGFDVVERDGKIVAGGGLIDWEFIGDNQPIFIPSPDMSGKPMAETPTPFNPAVDDCLRELRPILEKYLKPQTAIALSPEQIRAELLRMLGAAPALPGPATAEPEPAVPAAPVPTTPVLQKPSVALSGIGLAVTTLLQGLGLVGTPFGIGAEPTQVGTIATLAPVLTGLVGATGGWGMLLNLGLGLLDGLIKSRGAKK